MPALGQPVDYASTEPAKVFICMCVLASILAFGSCWAPGCFSASLPTVKDLPVMGWGGDSDSEWRCRPLGCCVPCWLQAAGAASHRDPLSHWSPWASVPTKEQRDAVS